MGVLGLRCLTLQKTWAAVARP